MKYYVNFKKLKAMVILHHELLNWKLRSNKKLHLSERVRKMQIKDAITDLNVSNGSHDNPF